MLPGKGKITKLLVWGRVGSISMRSIFFSPFQGLVISGQHLAFKHDAVYFEGALSFNFFSYDCLVNCLFVPISCSACVHLIACLWLLYCHFLCLCSGDCIFPVFIFFFTKRNSLAV